MPAVTRFNVSIPPAIKVAAPVTFCRVIVAVSAVAVAVDVMISVPVAIMCVALVCGYDCT